MFWIEVLKIYLLTWLAIEKLVCSDSDVVVNRTILCNCRLEAEFTYLFKSIGSCSDANKDLTLYFTINLAFYHYMNSYFNNNNTVVLNTSTLTPQGFAIALQPITNVNGQPIFEQPDTLKELNHYYNIKYK